MIFTVLMALMASMSFAEPKICQNLFAEACGNKKIISDPTGYSVHPEGPYKKKLAEKMKRFEAFYRDRIASSLADPRNKNILQSFAEFSGLKNCNSDPAKCAQQLSPSVASLLHPFDSLVPTNFEVAAFESAKETEAMKRFLAHLTKDYHQFFEDTEFKAKAEKMLKDLQKIMLEKLNTLSLAPHRKKAMIDKLSATKLVDCWGSMPDEDIVSGTAANYFGYSSNEICIQAGLPLQNTSLFNLAFALSHELTHALDPCAKEFMIGIPKGVRSPWMPVMQCLRSQKSMGAKASRGTLECDTGDQIGESFADWMGLEITVDYVRQNFKDMSKSELKNAWINMTRYSCETRVDEHPAMTDRMNKLILAHPEIRKDFGCTITSKAAYCSMDLMRQPAGPQSPNGSSRRSGSN